MLRYIVGMSDTIMSGLYPPGDKSMHVVLISDTHVRMVIHIYVTDDHIVVIISSFFFS